MARQAQDLRAILSETPTRRRGKLQKRIAWPVCSALEY